MPPSDLQNYHEQHLLLGNMEMDRTHQEFLELHASVLQASGQLFSTRFNELLTHTRQHFASEESQMDATGFPATAEHKADHQRVLGEMDRFAQRIAKGSTMMAKAWVKEQLPTWFETHVRSMDSALAAHLSGFADSC